MKAQLDAINPNYEEETGFNFESFPLSGVSIQASLIPLKMNISFVPLTVSKDLSPAAVMSQWEDVLLNQLITKGKAVKNRATFTGTAYKLNNKTYLTGEESFRRCAAFLFGMSDSRKTVFLNTVKEKIEGFGTSTLVSYALRFMEWNSSLFRESEKEELLFDMWNDVVVPAAKAAVPTVTNAELNDLKNAWPALASSVLDVLSADFTATGQDYGYSGVKQTGVLMGTLAQVGISLFYTHDYNMNLAWLRSYDSYYAKDTKAETAPEPVILGKPAAIAGGIYLSDNAASPTDLATATDIRLDLEGVGGEALYYTLRVTDASATGKGAVTSSEETLFFKDVPFTETCADKVCELTVYALLNGETGPAATYYFRRAPYRAVAGEWEEEQTTQKTTRTLTYTVSGNFTSDDGAYLLACAYDADGKMLEAQMKDVGTLTPEEQTGTFEMPLGNAEGGTGEGVSRYSLFLVRQGTFEPLADSWNDQDQ